MLKVGPSLTPPQSQFNKKSRATVPLKAHTKKTQTSLQIQRRKVLKSIGRDIERIRQSLTKKSIHGSGVPSIIFIFGL